MIVTSVPITGVIAVVVVDFGVRKLSFFAPLRLKAGIGPQLVVATLIFDCVLIILMFMG